jgi:methionine-rich copper-binding protein CopC
MPRQRAPRPIRPLAVAAVAALLACVALLDAPRPAVAHANFARSEPAPNAVVDAAPARLRIWFTEQPDAAQTSIEVYDTHRQRVAGGDPTPDPADPTLLSIPLALGPGAYTVAWKDVSKADGDPAIGFFGFVVGPAPLATDSGPQLGPQPADDLQVSLAASPGAAGPNALRVRVRDAGDQPPPDVQRVTLRLRPPPPDLGLSEAILPPADGGYGLSGLVLGLPGAWDVEVRVRRAGKADVSTHFTFQVGEAPAPAAPATAPAVTAAPPAGATAPAAPAAATSAPAGTAITAVPRASTPAAPAPSAAPPTAPSGAPAATAVPPSQAAGGPGSGQVVRAIVILAALVAAGVALPRLLRRRRG